MKKNSQLHLHLETELLNKLKEEVRQNYTTVSGLSRLKLRRGDFMQELIATVKSIERKVYSL